MHRSIDPKDMADALSDVHRTTAPFHGGVRRGDGPSFETVLESYEELEASGQNVARIAASPRWQNSELGREAERMAELAADRRRANQPLHLHAASAVSDFARQAMDLSENKVRQTRREATNALSYFSNGAKLTLDGNANKARSLASDFTASCRKNFKWAAVAVVFVAGITGNIPGPATFTFASPSPDVLVGPPQPPSEEIMGIAALKLYDAAGEEASMKLLEEIGRFVEECEPKIVVPSSCRVEIANVSFDYSTGEYVVRDPEDATHILAREIQGELTINDPEYKHVADIGLAMVMPHLDELVEEAGKMLDEIPIPEPRPLDYDERPALKISM